MLVRRIVAGVDGSDHSRNALAWAAELARAEGADLLAVHALGLLERLSDDRAVAPEAHRDEILQRFERSWTAPARDARVSLRCVLRDGPPVDVILAVAAEEHADLIVVGSRGTGGGPDQLLGSTSHRIAGTATCPVVIVPPADTGLTGLADA